MDNGIRLLVIEDVVEEVELASHQLRSAGIEHVLQRVETEAELRRALETFDPALILSDFTLPGFDGMSALRVATELRPEIPFVFFSGTIGEERAIEALKNGATDYVLKGNARRLAAAVTRAVGERAERAARHRAERLLRDSEERFRSIVETSTDWIWETDAAGVHVFCNPCAEIMLGYPRRQLLGAPRLTYVHPDDQRRFAQVFAEAVAQRTGWRGLVLRWRDAEGATRWLESNAVACLDEHGELRGFRGADRDITDRRRDEERIRRLSRVHAMLSNTNSAIVRIRDRDELLREACQIAVTHGHYFVAWAGVLDADSGQIARVACSGSACDFFGASGGESLLLRAIRSRHTAVLDRRHAGELAGTLQHELAVHGLSGAAALPLLIGADAVGVFALAGDAAQLFDEGEVKLLEELAGDLAFALQSIRQEAHLSYLSNYDALTDLPNRELFVARLQEFVDDAARGAHVAVVLFDVDRLSEINHTLGRNHGDQLLREIAGRVRAQFPDGGRAGYLGGGVYAVAFPGLAAEADAYRLHEWFDRHVLDAPFTAGNEGLHVVGTLALALHPADGGDAQALLDSAEIALRNAKSAGERVMFSSPQLNARVARRVALESRLRMALEREEFDVHLQPKVCIASSAVVGFEALLRWNGADQEPVAPETFVPVLEETGLIEPVGLWVLGRVCALEAQWRREGHTTRIAVNVCARQLGRADFARNLRATLEAHYVGTPGIDLEITESALLDDVEASVRLLEEIRELGLRIAIDDFGTGYSSLHQLVRLPIDTLKIDRSFVSGMNEDANVMAVVATITSLADALGLNTIAEGVENNRQLARLRDLGCREYQGFLFSPPVAAGEAVKLLL